MLRFALKYYSFHPMKYYLKRHFELSRGGRAHNSSAMEGLRGFAVSLVFIVHYVAATEKWISSEPLLSLIQAMRIVGNTGVDLFFVLSGYLIYGSLMSKRQDFFSFISRRVTRIYPAFIVMFVIYILLSLALPAQNKIPSPIGQGLIYLAANFFLLPGLFPIKPLITVAWSLSYEMFYYLVMPSVIAIFQLRSRRSAWRVALFLSMTAALFIYCAAAEGGPIRLIMFISGIVLYEAHENKWLPSLGSFVGFLGLLVGTLIHLAPIPGSAAFEIKTVVVFFAFFLLCLVCFDDSSKLLPHTFSWTPLRWLGNMSYSYYLSHGLTLNAAFLVLGAFLPKNTNHGGLMFWGLLPVVFALTLIPSAILFLAVERPFSLSAKAKAKAKTLATELPEGHA